MTQITLEVLSASTMQAQQWKVLEVCFVFNPELVITTKQLLLV